MNVCKSVNPYPLDSSQAAIYEKMALGMLSEWIKKIYPSAETDCHIETPDGEIITVQAAVNMLDEVVDRI